MDCKRLVKEMSRDNCCHLPPRRCGDGKGVAETVRAVNKSVFMSVALSAHAHMCHHTNSVDDDPPSCFGDGPELSLPLSLREREASDRGDPADRQSGPRWSWLPEGEGGSERALPPGRAGNTGLR